ncbi:hypothetical protein [Parendozoicomonas haliclonae]|nr:hypothetical protein [Parendozoicomonas haliclonae]
MRTTIDDFFCRTHTYRHTSTDTVAGKVSKYRLRTPEGTRPCLLVSATLDGKPLELTSPRKLDLENPRWREQEGRPLECWLEHDTLHVTPVPDKLYVQALHTTVALTITRNSTSIDTAVAEEHFNAFVNGTLGRLFATKGVDWFDPALSQSYGMMYEQAIETARIRGDKNDTAKRREAVYGGY